MGKTIEEYKKELESQITSFKNIHYALNSGSWHLEYDRHYHLTLVQWSDTLRQMLGFVSEADFPNTFEAWSSRLHPEEWMAHRSPLMVSLLIPMRNMPKTNNCTNCCVRPKLLGKKLN